MGRTDPGARLTRVWNRHFQGEVIQGYVLRAPIQPRGQRWSAVAPCGHETSIIPSQPPKTGKCLACVHEAMKKPFLCQWCRTTDPARFRNERTACMSCSRARDRNGICADCGHPKRMLTVCPHTPRDPRLGVARAEWPVTAKEPRQEPRGEAMAVDGVCEWCGEKWTGLHHGGKPRRFCKIKCRDDSIRSRFRKRHGLPLYRCNVRPCERPGDPVGVTA